MSRIRFLEIAERLRHIEKTFRSNDHFGAIASYALLRRRAKHLGASSDVLARICVVQANLFFQERFYPAAYILYSKAILYNPSQTLFDTATIGQTSCLEKMVLK